MRGDERLPVRLELERLAVVLADEVAQAGLGETDARAQLGRERPFEFLGRGVDHVGGRGWGVLPARGLVGSGVGREGRVEEGGGGGVDGAREEHEALGEDVGGESGWELVVRIRVGERDVPKDGMAVYACMLEIDARRAVRSDYDLQLQYHRQLE